MDRKVCADPHLIQQFEVGDVVVFDSTAPAGRVQLLCIEEYATTGGVIEVIPPDDQKYSIFDYVIQFEDGVDVFDYRYLKLVSRL